MPSQSTYSVIVPAAGIGKRMQSAVPKQYLTIGHKTILEYTLSTLLAHPQIRRIVVALSPEDTLFSELSIANDPRIETTNGGQERVDSVLAGLNYLDASDQWVLVHDAARPCLQAADVSSLLNLAKHGNTGGILAAPVRDTMKRANIDGQIIKTESRENLWHALTPQFFLVSELKLAVKQAQKDGVTITDEASAMEHVGLPVNVVTGKSSNIKVTQPEDLLLAEFYLTQSDNRILNDN